MSSFVLESRRSDEFSSVTSEYGSQAESQHELYTSSDAEYPSTTVTMNEPKTPDSEADISAVQKMLSAVSGSLLTSLLGIPALKMPSFNMQLI